MERPIDKGTIWDRSIDTASQVFTTALEMGSQQQAVSTWRIQTMIATAAKVNWVLEHPDGSSATGALNGDAALTVETHYAWTVSMRAGWKMNFEPSATTTFRYMFVDMLTAQVV